VSCSKALVKFRTNDRSGDGTGSFKVKIRANTEKFTNMITSRFRERSDIWSEKVRCSSRIKSRLRAE